MDTFAVEQDLKKLFVLYGPEKVFTSWLKVVSEFRKALSDYDTKPQTLTLTNVLEPVTKNPIEIPVAKPEPAQEKTTLHPDKEFQKEKMKLHKEAILKRRQELASQGVIPETQLTEENLKRWIQQEKKNYWTIAELTGCSDNDISHVAKTKNILSDVAMMIRKKRSQI